MSFIISSVLFVAAVITFIVCLPLFNAIIGFLPFSGSVNLLVGVLVLMLAVMILYTYVRQNLLSFQQGGVYR